jgi:hypothetical protein
MVRTGSVVGTPKNCVDLLEHGEAVIAFPEGIRGMNKSFTERYRLQEFGNGFMRLALQTDTPIVPVAVVGSEEQAISLGNFKPLARFDGLPARLNFFPLPTRYRSVWRAARQRRLERRDRLIGEKVEEVTVHPHDVDSWQSDGASSLMATAPAAVFILGGGAAPARTTWARWVPRGAGHPARRDRRELDRGGQRVRVRDRRVAELERA